MFTNKHVIAALIITPLLAIIAYFAVDNLVSEKPHAAVEGGTYKLIAKSNCRYGSGMCTLKNGDMEIDLKLEVQNQQVLLTLSSLVALDGVRVSLAEAAQKQPQPIALTADQGDPHQWQGRFDRHFSGDEILRLVASVGGAFYFGETVAAFAFRDNPYGDDKH